MDFALRYQEFIVLFIFAAYVYFSLSKDLTNQNLFVILPFSSLVQKYTELLLSP